MSNNISKSNKKAFLLYKVVIHKKDIPDNVFRSAINKVFFNGKKSNDINVKDDMIRVGSYPRDVAETKANEMTVFIDSNKYQLTCDIEKDTSDVNSQS